jgi:hypothetical protein
LRPVAETVAAERGEAAFDVSADEVRRLEQKIADLEGRWPAHSVPPGMWDELEALEAELDEARRKTGEESHGGQAARGRLPEV